MATTIEMHELADDLQICRILNGMWQVSGSHGSINMMTALNEMIKYYDCGFTSWDMADIYGPAETLFGRFNDVLASRNDVKTTKLTGLTKFVPPPVTMTKRLVENAVRRSLQRMNVSILDLIQFHWWDYQNSSYLDALRHLDDLKHAGLLRHLGLTNFDTQRMQEISDAGLRFVSNQVQYSILDQRPAVQMEQFCKKNKVGLLAYGTLAGGFFSEKYLGRPEPSWSDLNTASLQKYKHTIDVWGGWDLFQQLLRTLSIIAKKHGVSIANVATRYILDKPHVSGVIIGARLGISEHITDNAKTFDFQLDPDDQAQIDEFSALSNNLFVLIGDCGDEYRN